MIFDIISTITTIIPFWDFGKIKIEFSDIDIQFFKPIVGKQHWTEENYKYEPLRYRIGCKISVYNGKKKTAGIKNCKIKLNECATCFLGNQELIDFSLFLNIPANECHEMYIEQEETIFYAENIKMGYSFTFNYIENGKKKRKSRTIKSINS